jgi:hypothetical protein
MQLSRLYNKRVQNEADGEPEGLPIRAVWCAKVLLPQRQRRLGWLNLTSGIGYRHRWRGRHRD